MTHLWDSNFIFQSTLPGRGVTDTNQLQKMLQWISIHTPRAGSDFCVKKFKPVKAISIHTPRAGSDGHTVGPSGVPLISIHTPRAGSDSTASFFLLYN